ncbi:peptide chain release factor N(5)-glutamine methyltransferase [Candidatus Saccharibacteria bacterium]|nr:peptide chain release factor N(5)-glutamine methyltransferase [Candidatus Saccharibacteria bacterium]
MKVDDWLRMAANQLKVGGISTARLDVLVLLESTVRKDRAWLLAHTEAVLPSSQVKKLSSQLKRRLNYEPLAYIRGKSEFYGREFLVSKDTLEPRPETEAIIEQVKQLKLAPLCVLADVGTGSGALAITVKQLLPHLTVIATDISQSALKIARQNAIEHKVNIKFYHGNLLDPLSFRPDVIIANLPYVPDGFTINEAAMQEPRLAIFGGGDGLDLYRQLFDQLRQRHWRPQYIVTEALPPQHHKLRSVASRHGFIQLHQDDFIQVFTGSAQPPKSL